ncbi:MAG: HD domain-containing protein [Deltaproteobacteria bacterium]|nr:HD domain-containing protein [Deltaproteobacteria bacterium]
MEILKSFFYRHFEKLIVLSILLIIVYITYFVPYKIGFLNFFYLPIIIAGYYLGKRMSVLTAILCILFVVFFLILSPESFFTPESGKLYTIVSLVSWSSFLILASAALGYLYEEKERRIKELKEAYIGVLEILSKYLESTDRYTQGHSVRVAYLSEDVAKVMGLSANEVETIKAAALLHDIGKTEISMDIVNKAARLTESEKKIIDLHPEMGAAILGPVSGVLKEAVPIVLAHHKYYFDSDQYSSEGVQDFPIGASIIAVADAYDAIVTDRPYRAGQPPWKAYEEIEKETGKRFHPEVVKAFKTVLMSDERYRLEKSES